ncbi:MAG: WecB/TagA/CpsF family glycosyltransferase [Rubrobacteraceae bacterium]|nr:WecB/TagA/CpsF family glycosyltransferase [Rubrobacteraceae bacterium]
MALPVKSSVNVLGVGVDPLTVKDLHAKIGRLVRNSKRALVLSANANCLNLSHEDPALRDFLNQAEIVLCDGAGVMLAARILGGRIPERITYADWAWRLAAFAAAEGFSLFFLGARPGVAAEAARRLQQRYPALKIAGVHHGYFDHSVGSPENEVVLQEINASNPDILLIGLGMPLQEYWLMENLHNLNAGVVLTGGAVFDYVSGRLRRGPRLLTESGFEWLARLLIEPRRLWRRYIVGNPLFLLRVLEQRLSRAHYDTRRGGGA